MICWMMIRSLRPSTDSMVCRTLSDLDAKVVQNLGCQAFALTQQAQEQVLCSDIAVVGSFCFFLSERQNLLGPLSESFKGIQGFPPGLRRLWVGPAPPRICCGIPVGTSQLI